MPPKKGGKGGKGGGKGRRGGGPKASSAAAAAAAAAGEWGPEPTSGGGAAAAGGAGGASAAAAAPAPVALTEEDQLALSEQLGGLNLKLTAADLEEPHKFWDSQPVPKLDDEFKHGDEQQGPLDEPKTVDDVPKEGYPLPDGFEWVEPNVDDEGDLEGVYQLLNQHYVEDDDNMFRFDYSKPFLNWALKPPGFRRDWHLGIRVAKPPHRLVGFITAIPATIICYGKSIRMVEINFLCVHQKVRNHRFAPVLIKEITRRVNLQDIWQATFTAGRTLPRPITRAQYFHRNLNPKKLIDIGFSHLAPRMNMTRTIRLYQLPTATQLPGFRAMEAKDVASGCKVLNKYLEQFFFKAHFSEEEFAHWFLPRLDIVQSFVICDKTSGEVTDFVSFYNLPSSILNHPTHKHLKAAYSFYNVANTVPIDQLVKDALISAKQQDYDVYNCLELMHNRDFISTLKFGPGDGSLNYYTYNWRAPSMPPERMGLCLL